VLSVPLIFESLSMKNAQDLQVSDALLGDIRCLQRSAVGSEPGLAQNYPRCLSSTLAV
jgi:hypothetical protein